jgi:TolA-binding protein
MTNSSRKFLLALAALPLVSGVAAQTPPPAASAPRPVILAPTPHEQWQRQVDRQQIENRQRQSAVQQQIQQDRYVRERNATTNPALRSQMDDAAQRQQDVERARQDAAMRRYQAQPPVSGTSGR